MFHGSLGTRHAKRQWSIPEEAVEQSRLFHGSLGTRHKRQWSSLWSSLGREVEHPDNTVKRCTKKRLSSAPLHYRQ